MPTQDVATSIEKHFGNLQDPHVIFHSKMQDEFSATVPHPFALTKVIAKEGTSHGHSSNLALSTSG